MAVLWRVGCVLLLVGLMMNEADAVPVPLGNCTYNGDTYQSGDVIENIPDKCLQVVCENGEIENIETSEDCDCCLFNNKLYLSGSYITGQCFIMKCKKGEWIPKNKFLDCCRECYIRNDPHISTFDRSTPGQFYENHETCSYSFAQEGRNYLINALAPPDFAVYGSFAACNTGSGAPPSCVDLVNYKDSDALIINADCTDIPNIRVNLGLPPVVVTTAVQVVMDRALVWLNGQCIYILGTRGMLIMICPNCIHILAHPSLSNELYGLCGYFNFDAMDTFITRNGTNVGHDMYPTAFIESWLTDAQTTCPSPNAGRKKRDTGDGEVVHRMRRDIDPVADADLIEECTQRVMAAGGHELSEDLLQMAINTCVLDLISDGEQSQLWLNVTGTLVDRQVWIKENTISESEIEDIEDDDHHHHPHGHDGHGSSEEHDSGEGHGKKPRMVMQQDAQAVDNIACIGENCEDDHKLNAQIIQDMTANRTVDDCDDDCHRVREEFRMSQTMIIN